MKDKQAEYNIQKIISSDLERTRQTADVINLELNLPIQYTGKLRETNNGKIAGMLNEDVEKLYPRVYFNTLAMNEKYPGGESPVDFYNRIKRDFYEIIKENDGLENIMLVTHSGVINIIYHVIKDIEWSNKNKAFPASNTGIHRVVFDENIRKVDIENLTKHLATQ